LPEADVALVVGMSLSESFVTINDSEWIAPCLDHGFEYVSLLSSNDAEEGRTGIARIHEALQAHMWLASVTKAPSTEVIPNLLRDSHSDLTNHDQTTLNNFEDDFDPFITAPVANGSLSAVDGVSNDKEIEMIHSVIFGNRPLSNSTNSLVPDEFPADDEETFDLATTFERLKILKSKADGMDDAERRRFAEIVALGFASHWSSDD